METLKNSLIVLRLSAGMKNLPSALRVIVLCRQGLSVESHALPSVDADEPRKMTRPALVDVADRGSSDNHVVSASRCQQHHLKLLPFGGHALLLNYLVFRNDISGHLGDSSGFNINYKNFY